MKYETMEDFITAFRTRRGWSLRRMADELGYSSPTSIIRLCQGKANAESIGKFAAALEQLNASPITDDETADLAPLLDRSLTGDESYRANQLLLRLMQTAQPSDDMPVVLENADNGEVTTIRERYRGRRALHVTVLNSESVPIFAELALLESEQPFPLEHFFIEDGPAWLTVERIVAILPVLYNPHYQVFSRDMAAEQPMGMLQSDIMICEWEESGHRYLDLINFPETERGYYMNYCDANDRLLPMRMLNQGRSYFHPVRLMGMAANSSFVEYCAYCSELERDRSVMRVKADFGVDLIPTRLLDAAFRDGCPDPAIYKQMIPSLLKLFHAREKNVRTKRQPQYHVLMRWGVWRFVRTGTLSDHPWMLRPFTVTERREILQNIIGLMKNNRSFHLHFAADNDVQREDEFTLYDGIGLCIVKPHTDYNLGSGHAEILVSQKKFIDAYRAFFEECILRCRTISRERTMQLLQEMVRYLDDHPDESEA